MINLSFPAPLFLAKPHYVNGRSNSVLQLPLCTALFRAALFGGGESIRELQRESFVHKTSGFGVVFDATLKQKRLLVALKASQPPQLFG